MLHDSIYMLSKVVKLIKKVEWWLLDIGGSWKLLFSSIELLFYSSIEFQFDKMQNSKDAVNILIVYCAVYLKMGKMVNFLFICCLLWFKKKQSNQRYSFYMKIHIKNHTFHDTSV